MDMNNHGQIIGAIGSVKLGNNENSPVWMLVLYTPSYYSKESGSYVDGKTVALPVKFWGGKARALRTMAERYNAVGKGTKIVVSYSLTMETNREGKDEVSFKGEDFQLLGKSSGGSSARRGSDSQPIQADPDDMWAGFDNVVTKEELNARKANGSQPHQLAAVTSDEEDQF